MRDPHKSNWNREDSSYKGNALGRDINHPMLKNGSGGTAYTCEPSENVTQGKKMTVNPTKLKNLRGQNLLFRCLETGFVTTAPALGRYQRGRDIDPSRRELVGERPANWVKAVPIRTCEHCGMVVKGNQWTFRQHQQTKRCRKAQQQA